MTSWQTFWCHDVFLTLSHVFDVMTNLLTLWRTLWRYDVLKLSWQHKHGHNQMHTNISEWWCGQTLCWVGITCVQKHTHNLYLFRPILKIILAIIEMHMILCAKTLCCPHQGCLLTSTYCTCWFREPVWAVLRKFTTWNYIYLIAPISVFGHPRNTNLVPTPTFSRSLNPIGML